MLHARLISDVCVYLGYGFPLPPTGFVGVRVRGGVLVGGADFVGVLVRDAVAGLVCVADFVGGVDLVAVAVMDGGWVCVGIAVCVGVAVLVGVKILHHSHYSHTNISIDQISDSPYTRYE